jgi:hypothetical protein
MNMDFDFVRNFLVAVEREESSSGLPLKKEQLGLADMPDPLYFRQVILFDRAGLLETKIEGADFSRRYEPVRLTEAGHEFLNNIRDKKIWDRILSINSEEVETLSLSVLIALADRVIQMKPKED